MKKLQTLLLGGLMAIPFLGSAQTTPATISKGLSNGNPISASVFCADPTALEYNGRLYVYGTNDSQQFVKSGKKGKNSYGDIKSIVVFSTDDLVNWTFHGTIDTQKLCSGWVKSPWWHGYGVSWAPSVTWRTTADGKDEFFLYFCNSSHGVGVLKADSPIGPWTSPNKELIVTYDTPGANPQGTNANFDPGVVIDDNGVGWLAFGGLASGIMPNNAAHIIKLKPSMTAVDGTAAVLPAPYHFEANELNFIGGKYVYTYCSNWSRNQNDWNKYLKEHNINVTMPGTGTMCYMVSDNPLDPDSWKYKGSYGPHPGSSENNHSHLQKFQDNYYHIYHSCALLVSMKNAKAVDSSAELYRSICINKANVNESTQTINTVTLNNAGPTAIKNVDAYQLQQAETMANSGGVSYEDYRNITYNTNISTLKNDASENMEVRMKAGAWTLIRKVDFGSDGARSFNIRMRGIGKMELRWSRTGAAIATIDFSSITLKESATLKDYTIAVDPTVFNGVHDLYIYFPEANNYTYFDTWQFSKDYPTGIHPATRKPSTDDVMYSLSGRRLGKDVKQRGIYIKNGKKAVVK